MPLCRRTAFWRRRNVKHAYREEDDIKKGFHTMRTPAAAADGAVGMLTGCSGSGDGSGPGGAALSRGRQGVDPFRHGPETRKPVGPGTDTPLPWTAETNRGTIVVVRQNRVDGVLTVPAWRWRDGAQSSYFLWAPLCGGAPRERLVPLQRRYSNRNLNCAALFLGAERVPVYFQKREVWIT